MRRLVLTSLATALGSVAFASFDLFIMPDSVSGGYARYDPINRVHLGNINIAGGGGVAAASTRSWGYYKYSAGGFVAAVNNHTGERVSGFQGTFGQMAMSTDGTRVGASTAGGVSIYNSNAPLLSSVGSYAPGGGFVAQGVIAVSSNRWMLYGLSAGGNLDMYLVSATGALIQGSTNLISSANLSVAGQGAFGQGVAFVRSGVERVVIPYRDGAGAHRLFTTTTSFLTPQNQGVGGFSLTNPSTTLAAVAGHQGFFVVGADSTNSSLTRIHEYDDLPSYALMQNYTTNVMSVPTGTQWRMSNLVAPEPGTFVALALGGVALLRRRKK